MGQQGSNTTFRVGGTARQAGGNWTGRFENPEGLNAWHSMYGSRLEPGDTVTVGDAILKWNGSAYKVIDGDFVDGPAANAWAANFSPELASGSTATVNGQQVTWGGAGVGWAQRKGQKSGALKFASIGDSITQYFGGVPSLMCAVSNGKLIQVSRSGWPGYTARKYINGVGLSWIASEKPDVLRIQFGTNEAGSAITPAGIEDFKSAMRQIIEAGLSAGVSNVYLSLIPPRTASYTAEALRFNLEIMALAVEYGICATDGYISSRGTDGKYVAGYSGDGIHPNASKLLEFANAELAQLPFLAGVPKYFGPLGQPSFSGDGFANTLLLNDSNADGLADGITNGGYTTNSIIAGTFGNRQRQVATAKTTTVAAYITGPSVQAGDVIEASMFVKWAPADANSCLMVKFAGPFANKPQEATSSQHYFEDRSSNHYQLPAFEGLLHWRLTANASGTPSIQPTIVPISGTYTATVEYEQVQIKNLTSLGLA